RALTADHDHLGPGVDLLQAAQQRDPVDVGQHEVAHHDIRPPLPEDLLAPGADEGGAHFVPFTLDHHLEPLRHRWLIVNGEDPLAALRNGGRGTHTLYALRAVIYHTPLWNHTNQAPIAAKADSCQVSLLSGRHPCVT